jgi:hypothetical protein
MYQRSLWTLLWLAVGCPTGLADTFSVTLKAVDADTKPVARADVDLFWIVKDGAMMAVAQKPIVTDAAGKALLTMDTWVAKSFLTQKRAVLVLSPDRTLGGIVGVSKDDNGKELTAMLTPTVRVKAKLGCKELSVKPAWVNTTVTADGFGLKFVENRSESLGFEFLLPAGKYTFRSYAPDIDDPGRTVTLNADQPEQDFGTIELKASAIGKLKGKPPPAWLITDARGVNAGVKLADYKGKWVYIKFWGPC